MIQADEFRKSFQSQVEPAIKKYRKKRWIALTSALVTLLTIMLVLLYWSSIISVYQILIVLLISLSTILAVYTHDGYRRYFKQKVVAQTIGLIDPNYKFHYKGQYSLLTVLKSGIFYEKPLSVKGEYYVNGIMGETHFEFCELSTFKDRDKPPLFEGIFLKFDIYRQSHSKVYVFPGYPDPRTDSTRDFQKELGPWLRFPTDFKSFSVMSHDPEEAFKLIGPNMRKGLIALREKLHCPVYFAFHEKHVYCFITDSKKLFDPKAWYDPLKTDLATDYFNLFSMIKDVITQTVLSPQQTEEDRNSNPGNMWAD